MNPKAAQVAMEQLGRMTPEQMSKLQQQMGNISPDMMQAAMSQMSSMSDNDWDSMNSRINSMDPNTFSDRSQNIDSQFQAHQDYVYKGSLSLKEEGNRLHKSGNYAGAIEKYSRAKSNIKPGAGAEANKLRRICALNMASCHLKLNQFDRCVSECTDVLQEDNGNVKALYRRGQAYKGLQKLQPARDDLRKALELSLDDQDQAAMREKLNEVERSLGQENIVVEEIGSETWPTSKATDSGVVIEDITEQEAEVRPRSEINHSEGPQPSTSFPGTMPSVDPERMRQTADMIRQNPDVLKQTADRMAQMRDEDLVKMGKSTGLNISPDMVRAAQSMMSTMDPKTLEMMAGMAGSMPAGGRDGGGPAATPPATSSQGFDADGPDAEAVAKMYRNNPDLLKEQAQMLSKIPQEELDKLAQQSGAPPGFKLTPEMAETAAKSFAEMDSDKIEELAKIAARTSTTRKQQQESRSSPSGGGDAATTSEISSSTAEERQNMTMPSMPGMPNFSPEMMKAATSMMSQISPEEMAEMSKMAATMQSGGGTPSLAGMGSNPTMVRSMFKMMKSMDQDALADMCVSSGMCADKEKAKEMARGFSKMSEGQVEMMVKAAGVVQSGASAMKKTKDFLMGKTALILAIFAIILGILFRSLGWM
ncbi:hypothetical protein BSKO_05409 [Bryopsis sp. KO-2023]|nr:hypothetical protein BSKO_05409 [Bryopsis sp. KO-2023]